MAKSKVRGVFEKIPGSGVWWIQYFADGKRRRECVGRKSAAIELYQKRKADARAGVKLPDNLRSKGETLGQVIDNALAWYKSHRPKSLYNVTIHLEAIRKDLGARVAASLTPSDVDKWLSAHATRTDATRNRYKATLGRALQLAVVDGRLERNVARMVVIRREPPGRVRWLTDEEEAYLAWTIHRGWPEYLPSFYIGLHTGMRQGEQYGLEWTRVDFARGKVVITKTKTNSPREIPLSQTALDAFRELHAKRPASIPWVFLAARRKGERLLNPRQWFEQAVDWAGIKDFTWHDLRHTFCSRLVMAGASLKAVQELAGHKSITLTARYAHLAPRHLVETVELLDR